MVILSPFTGSLPLPSQRTIHCVSGVSTWGSSQPLTFRAALLLCGRLYRSHIGVLRMRGRSGVARSPLPGRIRCCASRTSDWGVHLRLNIQPCTMVSLPYGVPSLDPHTTHYYVYFGKDSFFFILSLFYSNCWVIGIHLFQIYTPFILDGSYLSPAIVLCHFT